jgi:hypothetical protein
MPLSVSRFARFLLVLSVVSLLCFSPASAFRVFLDHDTDGDLTTFRNLVEGPLAAPITIVVVFGPEDVGATDIYFGLEWDCTLRDDGIMACPHGDVQWVEPLPALPPFTSPAMMACTGFGCDCQAARMAESALSSVPVGEHRAFAILDFTREGCDPSNPGTMEYEEVEFRVMCSQCTYQPGDEPQTRMLLRIDPIAVETTTWGRVKARYGGL